MIIIPAELIALITFPGVVVHEIAHRFFCDVNYIPVYAVSYFSPLSKNAGCVIHQRTDNVFHRFLIGIGPLIINSLLCIMLTFPAGMIYFLGTDFVPRHSMAMGILHFLLRWLGYTIGFHAIPSNQDIAGLAYQAKSVFAKMFLFPFTGIIALFNINYIGFMFRIGYAYGLSLFLPALLWYFFW